MEIHEILTLAGIIITFFTTIIGWIIVSNRQERLLKKQMESQKELARLSDEIAFKRVQKERLLSNVYDYLREIEEWVEYGRNIYLKAVTVDLSEFKKALLVDPKDITSLLNSGVNMERVGDQLKERQKLVDDIFELREKAPRLMYLCKYHDPLYGKTEYWTWGDPEMPADLLQLLNSFEDEVLDQVYEKTGTEREHPIIVDQFYDLHEAVIGAINRLKRHYSKENVDSI